MLSSHPLANLCSLPTELRLKIWAHAAEPRTVVLHDLISQPQAFRLPAITQLNYEARSACRRGYQRAGRGSYFDFARDILVCDPLIVDDALDHPVLQDLAPKVQRLAFWDCLPDDEKVADPTMYVENLQLSFDRKVADKIEFRKLLFPNLKEMWVVKMGHVEPTWGVRRDPLASPSIQRRQAARQFRYWVKEGIIEMSSMDPDDADTKLILAEGRCRENHCQDLNQERPVTLSRVTFMDGAYEDRERRDSHGNEWLRLGSNEVEGDQTETTDEIKRADEERTLRWALVERVLMFSLRWDDTEDGEESSKNRGRSSLLTSHDAA